MCVCACVCYFEAYYTCDMGVPLRALENGSYAGTVRVQAQGLRVESLRV